MNDWVKLCVHGEYKAHSYPSWLDANDPNPYFIIQGLKVERWCEGGSPVTTADLEGETWKVCLEHRSSGKYETPTPGVYRCTWAELFRGATSCRFVERLLIPLPENVET